MHSQNINGKNIPKAIHRGQNPSVCSIGMHLLDAYIYINANGVKKIAVTIVHQNIRIIAHTS